MLCNDVIRCKSLTTGNNLKTRQLSWVPQKELGTENCHLVAPPAAGKINPLFLKGDLYGTLQCPQCWFYLQWWFKHPQSLKICSQWLSPISPAGLCWLISSENQTPQGPASCLLRALTFLIFEELPESSSQKRCWVRPCLEYLSDTNTHASQRTTK